MKLRKMRLRPKRISRFSDSWHPKEKLRMVFTYVPYRYGNPISGHIHLWRFK